MRLGKLFKALTSRKHENLFATGVVTMTLRGPDGSIKERQFKNLVVNTGKYHIADQLVAQLQAPMSHMAIGTGTDPAVATDTTLQTEISRKAFTSKTQGSGGDANQVTFIGDWAAGEGTGQITEAAIFNAASGGDMLCRTAFTVKDKGAADTLTLTWVLTIN